MTDNVTSRRAFLGLGLAGAAGTGLLAGCSGSSGAVNGSDLQIWGAFASQDIQAYFEKEFVRPFNQKSPVQVQLSAKPSNTIDRLTQTALASGAGPDIITADGPGQALSYARSGKIDNLDDYVDQFDWDSYYLDWALRPCRVDGRLMSLPVQLESLVLFYNTAVFKKHGWKPPTTRAELEAICADAQARGMMPLAMGNAGYQAGNEWYLSMFLNHAAGPDNVYQALIGRKRWASDVFVDAIELFKSYFDKGWAGGATADYFTNLGADLDSDLATGKAAMMPCGTWQIQNLPLYFGDGTGSIGDWDWVPFPPLADGVPDNLFPLAIGQCYQLNANTRHPKQGAAYLNYLVSDPAKQLKALSDVQFEPPPVHFSIDDFPDDLDSRIARLYHQLTTTKAIGYTTWTFLSQQSDTYLWTDIEKVVTGQLTARDYLSGMDEVFTPDLKSGNVPQAPAPMEVK